MHLGLPGSHRMTCRSPASGSRPSSGAGHLDASGDYLLLQLLDTRVRGVGDERAVAIVVDITDTAFLQSEGVDTALEGVVLHSTDRIERHRVHAFHHRSENVSGRFVVLIGIHSYGELVGRARGLEHTLSCRAGGVEDHLDTLVVLAERQLLALARILERVGCDAGVLRYHLTIRTHLFHTGAIARLEFVNQWDVHSTHESDFLRVTNECSQRADEIRSFLLAELERGDVGWRRNYVPVLVRRQSVVDAGECRVGIFLREVGEIVGEDETDADDEIHPLGGQKSQSRFAIGALTGLDEADVGAQYLRGAVGTGIGAVVEGLVASATDVEHDADSDWRSLLTLGLGAPTGEKESDVYGEQEGRDEDQLSHLNRRIAQNTAGFKTRGRCWLDAMKDP